MILKIDLELLTLPVKYLALCEILADLTESSIEEVNESVEAYIEAGHIEIEEINNEGYYH